MVATYLIASSFMSVYHMAVDTIFICASEYGIEQSVFCYSAYIDNLNKLT